MLSACLICIFLIAIGKTLARQQPGGPIVDELVCRKGKMPEFFDERCCGEDPYTLGHVTALLRFYKDCNVPPTNKTLNVPDSQWLFYKCLVYKSIVSNEITPRTYGNMMAGSLADPKKSQILEVMGKQAGTGETNQILALKKLWDSYFAAESQVCIGKAGKNAKTAPVLTFKSGDTPGIMFLPTTLRSSEKCQRKLEERFRDKNLNTSCPLFPLCVLTTSGVVSESNLQSKAYDYEDFLKVVIPNYFSQGSRDKLTKAMTDRLKAKFPKLGLNPNSMAITKEILKDHTNEINAIPEPEKTFLRNGFVLFELAMAAATSFGRTKLNDF